MNTTKPTLAFVFVNSPWFLGSKAAQVVEFDWEWKLQGGYIAPGGNFLQEYDCEYYSLQRRHDGWYITAKVGCTWDLATGWLDWDWLKEASLGHDILHWLIDKGVISETCNDTIDQELMLIARARGTAFGLKIRSWIIKLATGLCDERADNGSREVHYLFGGNTP